MITAVSPATAKAVMDVLLQRCLWASLHHDVPDFSSSAASELQFGGYGRQQVEWERSPGGWYASNEPAGFVSSVLGSMLLLWVYRGYARRRAAREARDARYLR